MPRPKLYNTAEERKEAKRMHKRAYYARNKSMISARMKDRYQARVVVKNNTNTDQSHKTSSDDITAQLITPKSSRRKLQGPLQKYLAGEPREVINQLVHDYLATGVSDGIRSAVGVVEDIFRELRDVEEDLLRQGKSSVGYTRACEATKDAKDVMLALEDVLSFILVNGMNVEELYAKKDFLFQKLWG